jgi:hypothetical protein
MSPSPSTAAATGMPASSSISLAMSITLYLKKGGPAGSIPRAPSQPNTSMKRSAISWKVCMVIRPRTAT